MSEVILFNDETENRRVVETVEAGEQVLYIVDELEEASVSFTREELGKVMPVLGAWLNPRPSGPRITDPKREAITARALDGLRQVEGSLKFELSPTLAIGLIGQLQLALRHPANTGPTRDMMDRFVRGLIDQIDPSKGNVHAFLSMGFDERYDE